MKNHFMIDSSFFFFIVLENKEVEDRFINLKNFGKLIMALHVVSMKRII